VVDADPPPETRPARAKAPAEKSEYFIPLMNVVVMRKNDYAGWSRRNEWLKGREGEVNESHDVVVGVCPMKMVKDP
jgi:hypothetical protein